MQSRPKRNSSSTQENILIQLWHFVFIELWSDYCLPLSKTHWLTHSCVLGLNDVTPGDDYAKSKLEIIGSLMTASNVCRDSWRSLSFVICQFKSNSCNPCVCGNVFTVQDWSTEDCWPSVNTRNIFPFQLRYMTWMADEYKCQTKYQGTNISCIEFCLPFNKLLQSIQKYFHFFLRNPFFQP